MSGTRRVVWSLGGNLGDVQDTLRTAVAGLAAAEGVRVVAVSGVVVTDPVGGVDQPDFLNIVVVAEASGTAQELLALGHCLEDAATCESAGDWLPKQFEPGQSASLHAIFLAADDSKMISAQDFVVDGGWAHG